jgi:hypothetical protein
VLVLVVLVPLTHLTHSLLAFELPLVLVERGGNRRLFLHRQ